MWCYIDVAAKPQLRKVLLQHVVFNLMRSPQFLCLIVLFLCLIAKHSQWRMKKAVDALYKRVYEHFAYFSINV
jgi:hypothetical protein